MMHGLRWTHVLVFTASLAVGWEAMSLVSRPEEVVSSADPVPAEGPTDSPEVALAPLRAAKDRWTAIHAAIQLAREMPPQERLAWLDGAKFRHSDPLVVQMFMAELEELLYSDDPYGFVATSLAKERRTVGRYLTRLSEQDAEGLIAFGKQYENPELGRRMMLSGMKVLVEKDPARVLALALEFPPPGKGEPSSEMTRLLAKAAANDSGKLLDLADQRGDRWRGQLRAAATQVMAKVDMANAIRWLSAQSDGARLYEAAFDMAGIPQADATAESKRIAEHAAEFSPKLAAELNGTAPEGWPGIFRMMGCEESWLAADLSQLGFSKGWQADVAKTALTSLWARDPVAAARYLAENQKVPAQSRQELMRTMEELIRKTGRGVPAEAASLLEESEFHALKEIGAPRNDPPKPTPKPPTIAEQFANAMNDPDSDALMLRGEWTSSQMEEALYYVRSAPPEQLQEMATRLLHTGAPNRQLAAEIYRLALVHGVSTAKTNKAMIETSIHWGGSDPISAAAWATSFPAGKERISVMQNIAAQWSFSDPEGAESWIAGLKDPEEARQVREAVKIALEQSR
ncbi:MAG TPA: hypothetical protein VGE67_14385 [Haloferula sp.]